MCRCPHRTLGGCSVRLRSYRLLEGYRGSAKANIEQFRQILMQVNQLLLDFPAICEMDMNPLIFDETRGAFYAVDAAHQDFLSFFVLSF